MVAQMGKNLPAMQEAWVQSLGQEDPLEKGMATHSSILALRIPWIEELRSYIQSSPWGQKSWTRLTSVASRGHLHSLACNPFLQTGCCCCCC